MGIAAREWNKLCEELLATLAEEMRLLGASSAGEDGPDLAVLEQFEVARERTSEVKQRMDAWLDAHTH